MRRRSWNWRPTQTHCSTKWRRAWRRSAFEQSTRHVNSVRSNAFVPLRKPRKNSGALIAAKKHNSIAAGTHRTVIIRVNYSIGNSSTVHLFIIHHQSNFWTFIFFSKNRSKHTATCTQVENNSSEGNNVSVNDLWKFNSCSFSVIILILWILASTKQFEYDGNETGENHRKGHGGEPDCEYSKSKLCRQRHAKCVPKEFVASKIQCKYADSRSIPAILIKQQN